jgi:hypothetical protein
MEATEIGIISLGAIMVAIGCWWNYSWIRLRSVKHDYQRVNTEEDEDDPIDL